MLQVVLIIIGLLFLVIGVIMIYDARLLTQRWFSFGDQNEASTGFKIMGFILCIIGALLVYFNKIG
jgi:hypothetical protein